MTGVPLLVLLLLGPARDGPAAPEAAFPARTRTVESIEERDGNLRRDGEEGRARLAREAAGGTPRERAAALRALGTLEREAIPPAVLETALAAVLCGDPDLRAAGVQALVPFGRDAERRLAPLLPPLRLFPWGAVPAAADLPRRNRAWDAWHEVRRAAVERDFLSLWTPDDGTFHGMYDSLRRHGPFGARVLAAIALDRRMAGSAVLGCGPYAWRAAPAEHRDRSDCRYRALEALSDAGTPRVRAMLGGCLRARPAPELYDDFDQDPIPALLDDALRETIAALGEDGPLWEMIVASRRITYTRGPWTRTIEMRRQATAFAVLAAAAPTRALQLALLERAEHLQIQASEMRPQLGIAPDGVDQYNLACLCARRNAGPGDRARALGYLEEALRGYSISSKWLLRDGDLRSLHAEPRFLALVEALRAKERALEAPPK